ncbi:hypothetical protein DKP76_17770 [Falsochrobactrum shanghaiense]|uniref:Uncharacterized protein n=1 Tax=Falsochrobactrum shanghaiense TaxID=2201899 RepID=A0A316J5C8_9HYPH|nr:hypothetical protein [Falsochrobactrum shanghaiense]PWL16368.1 hypothetical protein DKP76_17770 [Falsochrobactrum shanghaiense]
MTDERKHAGILNKINVDRSSQAICFLNLAAGFSPTAIIERITGTRGQAFCCRNFAANHRRSSSIKAGFGIALAACMRGFMKFEWLVEA